MRRLVLLALVTLVAFPLSAHGRWRAPRRVVVIEPGCGPVARSWEADRWEGREFRRAHRHDRFCEGRIYLPQPRPLAPPFRSRVELRFR